jgi:hypothetical protein
MANFNYERLHRNAASASRSSSVGSIIVSFDDEPCRKDLSPDNDCSICRRKIKRKKIGEDYAILFGSHFA